MSSSTTATASAPSSLNVPATGSTFSILRQALFNTSATTAPIFLRLALAVVLFPHGAQKLLGWFGGYGLAGTMSFFTEQMGIPYVLALGAVLVEFFGPLLLLLGLATRPAALAIGAVMSVAMVTVQLQHGFFMNWYGNQAGEGIEYTLLMLGIVLALIVSGGGLFSLDRLIAARNAR
ncbi:DoxX family protein [Actomonas aquatica]|uniref:DoxX family protein n=1 Tax=Actomonas aquatica TaxID=2866162 RepID=A0ABZ1C8J0_9BACT|nr:DoxX family protein [Opitutus sp. WL0086]WRQ87816.1 DoxX family protein [Opitutus sp. WL0086]